MLRKHHIGQLPRVTGKMYPCTLSLWLRQIYPPVGARYRKRVNLLLSLAITLAIACGTGGLQIVMKGISRTELPGKKHGLTQDDALFWTDWTISAALALIITVVVGSTKKGPGAPISQVILGFVSILLACSVFPFLLRLFAYDPGAQIKRWGWKGIGWILIANGVGMIVLLAAVAVGVKIYA